VNSFGHIGPKAAALRALALLLVAVGLLVVATGWPLAAQEGGINFVVEPAPGSQTAEGGGYFVIPIKPGVKVVQSLALRNDSGKPLALRLAAVDAATGPFGGVSYGLEDEPATKMGAWISLERTSVTLAPGESKIVGFELEVPRDADSGEHLAGISVYSPAPESKSEEAAEGEAGAAIHVQTRRIVAVQANLPGPSRPELVISGIDAAARPDGLYLEIGIENAGRGLTKGQGLVKIPAQGFDQSFDIDTLVPGTSIAYPVKWTDSVAEGEYSARVEVEYEGGVANWEGTFTVGPGVLEELAERGVEIQPATATPWWAVVLGALILVALALVIGRRRFSRRPLRVGVGPATQMPPPPRRTSPPPPPPRVSDRDPAEGSR